MRIALSHSSIAPSVVGVCVRANTDPLARPLQRAPAHSSTAPQRTPAHSFISRNRTLTQYNTAQAFAGAAGRRWAASESQTRWNGLSNATRRYIEQHAERVSTGDDPSCGRGSVCGDASSWISIIRVITPWAWRSPSWVASESQIGCRWCPPEDESESSAAKEMCRRSGGCNVSERRMQNT